MNKKQYIIKEKKAILHVWSDSDIKKAFNFNNGTIKDLKRYIKNNNLKLIII